MDLERTTPGESSWAVHWIALWAIFFLLVAVVLGPGFVRTFRPPEGVLFDFVQDWLSAKNYFAGDPVYADQPASLLKHTGLRPHRSEDMLPFNAHPPGTVLLALPFAFLDYANAHLAWNLITFVLFLVAVALVVVELEVPLHPAIVLPLGCLLLLVAPVWAQLLQGQLNFLLAFLLTLGWVADRRGYPALAGTVVGLAAAIKLFPAFLVVYFAVTRRWSGAVALVVAFAAVNGVALALFGIDTFRTYGNDVLSSLKVFISGWRNLSLSGFFARLFDPQPVQPDGVNGNPFLARLLTGIASGVVIGLVLWVCFRATDRPGRDRAWAAGIAALVLLSPTTWSHYFLVLLVPVGLLWMRLPGLLFRLLLWVAIILMAVPPTLPFFLVLAPETARQVVTAPISAPLTVAQNLGVVSLQTYALVTLFALTFALPGPGTGTEGPAEKSSTPARETAVR
jgi:hypothetical protein